MIVRDVRSCGVGPKPVVLYSCWIPDCIGPFCLLQSAKLALPDKKNLPLSCPFLRLCSALPPSFVTALTVG